MQLNEIRVALQDARTNRDRLLGEVQNLRAREAADGDNAGIEERLGNVNRGIEAADRRTWHRTRGGTAATETHKRPDTRATPREKKSVAA